MLHVKPERLATEVREPFQRRLKALAKLQRVEMRLRPEQPGDPGYLRSPSVLHLLFGQLLHPPTPPTRIPLLQPGGCRYGVRPKTLLS